MFFSSIIEEESPDHISREVSRNHLVYSRRRLFSTPILIHGVCLAGGDLFLGHQLVVRIDDYPFCCEQGARV